MKNVFRKSLNLYLESVGFLVAVLFFILSSPIMLFCKMTGLKIEEEW